MEVFTLAAKLVMDTSGFSQSVKQAAEHGSSLNDKLGKIVKTAAKVAAALVFKKGVTAMKQLADAASAAGDKIDKQSQALGLSRKAYQEWDYILSQNGSSIDSLGVSMKTLNNSILSNNQSITKLGLSFEKLDGMNMEQQFEAVVRAFQEMPAGAEKSALAVELFGRNGMELLPLLNNSATSIDELRQKFHDLGMEMTDDQINSAVRYSDAMDTLNRVFNGIKYTIGAELLPTMADWAEKAADYAGKLLKAYKDDGLSGVFKILDEDITKVTDNLKNSGNPVLAALGLVIDGIKNGIGLAVGLFTDFPGTVRSLKESDSTALRALGETLDAIGEVIGVIITAFESGIDDAIKQLQTSDKPVLQVLGQALEVVKAAVETIMSAFNGEVADSVKKLQESDSPVLQVLGGALEAIGTVIATIVGGFNGEIPDAVKKLQESDSPVLQLIGEALQVISEVISAIKTGFQEGLPDAIKKLQESDSPVLKLLGDALSGIKSIIDGVINSVKDVIDWFKKLMGFNGQDLSETTSGHTHTNTTINRVYYETEGTSATITSGATGEQIDTNNLSQFYLSHHHAKGLWNVPYDNYPALLHRGERVLTASQARRFRDGEGGIDYARIGAMIGASVERAIRNVNVYLGADRVGALTSDYVDQNIKASDYAILRGMGG